MSNANIFVYNVAKFKSKNGNDCIMASYIYVDSYGNLKSDNCFLTESIAKKVVKFPALYKPLYNGAGRLSDINFIKDIPLD